MTGFVNLSILVYDSDFMTRLNFFKYHGTGNDFILVDNRSGDITLTNQEIGILCDRRLGIGADGLMLLQPHNEYDFEMKYFNADGFEGSMCGNGGRVIASFAHHLGMIAKTTRFLAVDGVHQAEILSTDGPHALVKVSLNAVDHVQSTGKNTFVLDTGSPHYVEFITDLSAIDVFEAGKKIRWDERFQPGGINVNFAETNDKTLIVRTFERGVENITRSCGTGVAATAIAASMHAEDGDHTWELHTLGGVLTVSFSKTKGLFTNIWLTGPAEQVFAGTI